MTISLLICVAHISCSPHMLQVIVLKDQLVISLNHLQSDLGFSDSSI